VQPPSIVGLTLSPHRVRVDADALRRFAAAIGEDRPLCLDEQAACSVGHRGLPVLPSFLFCLNSQRTDHARWREPAGFRRERLLHAAQSFTYHRMAYAGDELTFATRVAEQYTKKAGALSFVVLESRITNQFGEHVADMRNTLAHRNG